MFGVYGVEYFVEVGTTEVCCRLQSSEDAATRHSLEMFLADVLQQLHIVRDRPSQPSYLYTAYICILACTVLKGHWRWLF